MSRKILLDSIISILFSLARNLNVSGLDIFSKIGLNVVLPFQNGDMVYGQYGLQSNMTDAIRDNIRKSIPKYKEDLEVKIVKVSETRNVDRNTNAR